MSLILTHALIMLLSAFFTLLPTSSEHPILQDAVKKNQQEKLMGAWELASGAAQYVNLPEGATAVMMIQDGYFTVAYFNEADKKFIGTFGGTYSTSKGELIQSLEYNTLDSATVGTTNSFAYTLASGQLQIKSRNSRGKLQQTWSRINKSDTASPLEGTWRITGRAGHNGTIEPMRRGPRKTLKILTGNRFQWIAFNTETKQFSGTGGGVYTAKDGKYTENIEFFSRDSSRVGANLTFNYEVRDGKWHHSGQSSTGNKINEVWERGVVN